MGKEGRGRVRNKEEGTSNRSMNTAGWGGKLGKTVIILMPTK